MSGNRTGVRKRILFYVALLTCLSISSCASLEKWLVGKTAPERGAREHLAGGRKALAQHDYQASLQEFDAALSLSGNKPPGDEALLNMGMVYGDPENPKRDYPKSIAAFQRLAKEYPQGNWAEPARIWTGTLKEQEKLKRAMSENIQENERLKRLSNETAQENQRLKDLMEQSKTVDVQIEEKKRGQGQ
jgi:tetratricopeptide (TPR) repeat protein